MVMIIIVVVTVCKGEHGDMIIIVVVTVCKGEHGDMIIIVVVTVCKGEHGDMIIIVVVTVCKGEHGDMIIIVVVTVCKGEHGDMIIIVVVTVCKGEHGDMIIIVVVTVCKGEHGDMIIIVVVTVCKGRHHYHQQHHYCRDHQSLNCNAIVRIFNAIYITKNSCFFYRDSAPGQRECDEAIENINRTINKLDQASLAAIGHNLDANPEGTLKVCEIYSDTNISFFAVFLTFQTINLL